MLVAIRPQDPLEDGVEARGFWCESEGFFVHEDQFDKEEINTDEEPCASCGAVDCLIPVVIVQRPAEIEIKDIPDAT